MQQQAQRKQWKKRKQWKQWRQWKEWNRSRRKSRNRKGRFGWIAALLLACWAVGGCSEQGASGGKRTELLLSAAASMQASMQAIETAYERLHPDVDLRLNYGSSGALQKQIEQGAPADLFLSAGLNQMRVLEDAGLVRDSVQLLGNKLVAIVSDEAARQVGQLDDVRGAAIRVMAIGDPATVPAGLYAEELLNNAGLWEEVKPKLVLAKDVRQVVTYVESGNAELGFVYKTDALASSQADIAFEVDPALHSPIVYPVATMAESRHPEAAAQLLAYLQGDEARAIFEQRGFTALRPQ